VSLLVDELKGCYNNVLNIHLKFMRKVYLNRESVKGFFRIIGTGSLIKSGMTERGGGEKSPSIPLYVKGEDIRAGGLRTV
jgi:hypothetical protein